MQHYGVVILAWPGPAHPRENKTRDRSPGQHSPDPDPRNATESADFDRFVWEISFIIGGDRFPPPRRSWFVLLGADMYSLLLTAAAMWTAESWQLGDDGQRSAATSQGDSEFTGYNGHQVTRWESPCPDLCAIVFWCETRLTTRHPNPMCLAENYASLGGGLIEGTVLYVSLSLSLSLQIKLPNWIFLGKHSQLNSEELNSTSSVQRKWFMCEIPTGYS
jgi:hypothetical protein